MKTHSPPGAHIAALFVKRMLSAKNVVPSLNPANGLSPAWLASSTSRSTTSRLAAAINRSCTPDPATANSPEPGVAHVSVTSAVAIVSSWVIPIMPRMTRLQRRSEEHTSELQSHSDLVCRLLLEKKK